jgi:hypothetical protein
MEKRLTKEEFLKDLWHPASEMPDKNRTCLVRVVYHIPDLQRTFITLKKYLKVGGKLVIIDCNKGHYKTNVFLDNLWYRFVGNNNEIFISKQYRDYINVLIKLGFKQLYYKSFKEKEITKYECN